MSASATGQRVLQKGDGAGFERASELAERGSGEQSIAASLAPGQLVVAPEVSLEQAKKLWNEYLGFKNVILADPDCADDIAGHREMNRTGATRLATVFGLTVQITEVSEGRVENAETGEYDYRFLLRVRVGKGNRWVDGIASCRLEEIPDRTKKGESVPYSQREHFALTKAQTRAVKRAIADLLGGTEAE